MESLATISRFFNLTRQHRCTDEEYTESLNHLHYWRPTTEILRTLQHERLLNYSQLINDTDLLSIIRNNASSTFVTMSRNAASRINRLILQNLFSANLFVSSVQVDNDEPPTNIFKGMRIIVTQNR